MSTAVKRNLSVDQAAKQAARRMGLEDAKRLSIALAVAAAEESDENAAFAARVRAIYSILPPTSTVKRSQGKKASQAFDLDLVPIKQVDGFSFDPSMPIDPYLVYDGYGGKQLSQVLAVLSLPKLKQSSALVEQRNPGTKPKSRANKVAIIDYIMEHVAP